MLRYEICVNDSSDKKADRSERCVTGTNIQEDDVSRKMKHKKHEVLDISIKKKNEKSQSQDSLDSSTKEIIHKHARKSIEASNSTIVQNILLSPTEHSRTDHNSDI